MKLQDFKLLKEDDNSYHIAHPSGKKMIIDKNKLSKNAGALISTMKSKPKKYDEGGEVQASDNSYDPTTDVNSSSESGSPDSLENATSSEANSSPQTVDSFEFKSKAPNASLPTGAAGSLQAPNTNPGVEAGLREQQAAAKAYADAISGQGTAEVNAQKNVQDQLAKLPSIADIQQKYTASDQAYKSALDNAKIDPNRFWNNLSTPQQIFASLGMILSGGGAAVAHQQPMAQQFIQNAIERDIDAQKNNQSKIMNAWKMNREALGSDMAANIATRQQAYINVSHQLDQAASQFKGPIAQANYLKAKGMIDQELAVNRWKMSKLEGPTQESAGGAPGGSESAWQNHLNGLQLAFPEYYKDAQSKYVPSVGMASVPVTPDDKTELTNYDNLSRQLKGALDFQNQVGLTGAWTPQTKAQANTIKQNLVLSMNQLNNSKRPPSPEVMKLYNEAVGGIGNVNLGGTKQEIQDLQEQVQGRKENLMNHLGIKPFSDAGSSNIIRSQNGVKYEKVPGGWKKI